MFGNKGLAFGPFLAVLFLLFPLQAWSQELPEGVGAQVVAEYAVDIPGVEKVELRQLSLAPGASWEFEIEDTLFCDAIQGVISVVDHTLGDWV